MKEERQMMRVRQSRFPVSLFASLFALNDLLVCMTFLILVLHVHDVVFCP